MPKLVKPIQDNSLQDPDILRREDIYLSPETHAALIKLAKKKLEASGIVKLETAISAKKATELALFWVKSGQANDKIRSKLTNLALLSSPETLHEACLKAFLEANSHIKVRREGEQGRVKGFIPPSKKLKIAMGEVISDLINSSPSVIKSLRLVK
jgi:hypothetical protein